METAFCFNLGRISCYQNLKRKELININITKYLTTINFNELKNKSNKYIVIHYTANDGDTALNNAKYFYSENRGASAHYFVDENEIVQVVEDSNMGWHCGTTGTYVHSECRNSNSIGIEMCSRKYSDGTYYIKDEVVASTIELTKYLMDLYDVPLENVLMHYDVTGKICPAPFVNDMSLWTDFKSKLQENEIMQDEQAVSSWAEDGYKFVVENEISDGTRPQDLVTREEAWTMLQRFFKIQK